MSEPMSDERRAEIEAYLSSWASSDDEPWTIPDMLREALTEIDRLLERERLDVEAFRYLSAGAQFGVSVANVCKERLAAREQKGGGE